MRVFGLVLITIIATVSMYGQGERKYIRRGNREFEEKKFTEAEIRYRNAIDKEPNSFEASFNIGDALYEQEKYQEAAKKFSSLTGKDVSDEKLAKVYHNLGNSLFKSDKLKESIEAYKNALKHNPGDMETKHNLTYALEKLKEKQNKKKQDQQKQKKNQQNQNKNKNQKNKPEDKKNQNNQNQQNQQNKQEQKKQDNKNKNQPQPQPEREISKKDAERLLKAIANDEKKLQKKLKKKKAKVKSAKTVKEW